MKRSYLLFAVAAMAPACATPCEDDGIGQRRPADCTFAVSVGSSTGVQGQSSTGEQVIDSAAGSTSETTATTAATASTGDVEPSTGSTASTQYCADADQDTFGSRTDCTDVLEGEVPPEGWVDNADDCKDDDAFTFPGAAALDDPSACMQDGDEDGYGNSSPPKGVQGGTDCADQDADVPANLECLTWCVDSDDDQFGDGGNCVESAGPIDGYVANATDCDDSNGYAYPGAVPQDDPDACLEDKDGDDYGTTSPPPGVDAGSDCDDLDALVTADCFDCPAGTFSCAADDDLYQCNKTGTFAFLSEDCGYGCDDAGLACWPELTAVALADGGMCLDAIAGTTFALEAVASGGDGNFDYTWAPADLVSEPDQALTSSSVASTSVFEVTVLDAEGNSASDSVTVHTPTVMRNLEGPGCAAHLLPDAFALPPSPPEIVFFDQSQVYCNLASSSRTVVYVCPPALEQARVNFRMQVLTSNDDDAIGFVWGWQDPSHFYVLSWKQATQMTDWGVWSAGMTVKRISAPSLEHITPEDIFANADTPNSVLLMSPAQLLEDGWQDNTEYTVELELDGPDTTITVRLFSDASQIVTGTVSDGAYPAGMVGTIDASQLATCLGYMTTSCL